MRFAMKAPAVNRVAVGFAFYEAVLSFAKSKLDLVSWISESGSAPVGDIC
jgi:hypothetical protein